MAAASTLSPDIQTLIDGLREKSRALRRQLPNGAPTLVWERLTVRGDPSQPAVHVGGPGQTVVTTTHAAAAPPKPVGLAPHSCTRLEWSGKTGATLHVRAVQTVHRAAARGAEPA